MNITNALILKISDTCPCQHYYPLIFIFTVLLLKSIGEGEMDIEMLLCIIRFDYVVKSQLNTARENVLDENYSLG